MKLIGLDIKNNAVLGNLSLEFFDTNGNIFDTIIFAGGNGCGKTTLLNIISDCGLRRDFSLNEERTLLFLLSEKEADEIIHKYNPLSEIKPVVLEYHFIYKNSDGVEVGTKLYSDLECKHSIYPTGLTLNKIVYLTPEIQFGFGETRNVTSMELDTYKSNNVMITDSNSAKNIVQLLVDINNQDALDFSKLYASNPSKTYGKSEIKPRVERFNKAFKYIIDDFGIDTIDNVNDKKNVVFSNKGKRVPISKLSSGEKQLIFRGGFLLKDKNALNEAIVLIDEPEISLHPDWQKKIIGFYRNILSDAFGNQTSQLFIATHSPFIIHNENRVNDKVFVLKRDNDKAVVLDKPEYYSCNFPIAVEDAFNVRFIQEEDRTVFLEGRTDEKYFNKAIQLFKITTKFKYKWIGYIDTNGQERNTGHTALDHAFDYLVARNNGNHYVLFYDCDTNKAASNNGLIAVLCAQQFASQKGMNKGIENALSLDDIDLSPFYRTKTKNQDYGCKCEFTEFDKMALCDFICNLNDNDAKTVLKNIEDFINQIESRYY